MKRFLPTLAVLAAICLVSSSCNVTSSSSTAATVVTGRATTVITTSQLNSAMATLAADPGFLCIGGLSTSTSRTAGAGVGTYDLHYAQAVLTKLVEFTVTRQLVSSMHLATPSSASAIATDQVDAGVATQLQTDASGAHPCTGTAQAVMAGLGSSFRNAFDSERLEEDAIEAHLAGTSLDFGALASYEQAHLAASLESCTSIIDVATTKLALQLRKQIVDGASFASVADAHASQGTGAGGTVGCPIESDWVAGLGATVAALKVGQVSKPVAYNGSYLLILVSSRKLEPAANVVAQLATTEQAAYQTLYGRALQQCKVSVAPVYGSWARVVSSAGIQLGINSPPDRAVKFAPNSPAVLGPTVS